MPTLQFKGKSFVQNHHLAVKFHQLVGVKGKSLTDKLSLHDNLIVQGDNLKALKALLPTYAGKVKCIYIDPPYNTGNEKWVYNDNVNSPMMQEWLGGVVDKDDLTRHDKWLCMMMPRLKLLKELLAEDGAIFVSIDDNEQHVLRVLMDEIFGQHNFVANIIWQKNFSPRNTAKWFSEDHDYVICYASNKEVWNPVLLERTEEQLGLYSNPDNDPRGPWASGDVSARNPYDKGRYEIVCPSGRIIKGPPPGTFWRFSEKRFKELDADGRIWWGEKGENSPRFKRYLSDVRKGIVPRTIWLHTEAGNTQEAKKEINELLDFEDVPFQTPKPSKLIQRILAVATSDEDIVLDSFSGSGTTAHAVLKLNKEDGGNRRFILVEMEDYADTITAERVRRVINGVPKSKNFQEGAGGTFSYFKLGPPIEMEQILHGKNMPSYEDLARYVYFTATGEEFNAADIDQKKGFIGNSKQYPGGVFLYYEPDMTYLMNTALTLDMAKALGPHKNKKRLVFAPQKYLDQDYLDIHRIDYHQLPFEIYRFKD
jgi:adenine-specific DNA-methyltransferase